MKRFETLFTAVKKSFMQKSSLEIVEDIMKFTVLLLLLFLLIQGCSYLNDKTGLGDDNPIEEAVENQLKSYTGLDIDLTPHTEE